MRTHNDPMQEVYSNKVVVVFGGWLDGSAIAHGFASNDLNATVLNGEDRDIRSDTANSRLVWAGQRQAFAAAFQSISRF